MLDAGRPPQFIGGLIVFFDHVDERLRYVVPEVPRARQDPEPRVSLVLYRDLERDDSGGLLQLESTLEPTEDQLAAVEKELRAAGRPATLARPDWRAGTVRVAGWLDADALAPLQLAIGVPSLIGDPNAMLAARLTADGAALAEQSLRGNALPTVLMFEIETLGLAGPLSVEVEADLQAMHDRMTAEGALTTPYGRARIAKTWEEMARDNLIRVTILDQSGDFESQRAEAMRRVGEELLAKMFSPYPPAEKPQQLSDDTVAPLELSFRLTMRREELQTRARWNFSERRAVPVRHYAAASLIGLLADSPADRHISFIDLAEERFTELVVRVEPELDALGIAAVEVDVRRAGRDDTEYSFSLTDGDAEISRRVELRPDEDLEYRVVARFNPDATSAADRRGDWLPASGSLIVVSARALFPPRELIIIAGRGEFDWLDHVEVIASSGTEPARSDVLGGTRRSVSLYFPAAADETFSVTTHWRGQPGEPSRSDTVVAPDDDIVVVDSPFGDSLNLLVVPLPLADVLSVAVDVRTGDDTFTHTRSLSWDDGDTEPQRASLRRLHGSPREFEYRATLIKLDGSLDQTDWTTSQDPSLIIGADQPMTVFRTSIVVLGGGPQGRGSMAIELTLASGEHTARTLLEDGTDETELVLVVPEAAAPPVLTSREFLTSGKIVESRWEQAQTLIVIPPPSSGDG